MNVIGEIEILLKEAIGLEAASIGTSSIERAVEKRRAACGAQNFAAYFERLRVSPIELQELVEAVVVSETWFFRDEEAFKAMAAAVKNDWFPLFPPAGLRLLSVPCATGEEPFSMAMTLDELELPPLCYRIDAVDVSEEALVRGRRGLFRANSFRNREMAFRDKYFLPEEGGFRIEEELRSRVFFQRANLLHPGFFVEALPFHFIFCRNLLIYLDQSAQDRAVETLKRLLDPKGILFVGPAEAALMLNHRLVAVDHPRAFAFRKEAVKAPKKPVIRVKRKMILPPSRPVAQRIRAHSTRRLPLVRPQAPLPAKELGPVRQLAGEGRLPEAAAQCELYLQAHRTSAEAFYLRGVLADAMGERDKALTCYRKVIYLEPDHYDSLMHLAYAAEKEGDTTAYRNLRARAERAKEKRNVHA